ncbi:MAG: hypothetical protein ACOCXW_00730 [Bacteroidota bacterium]
MKKTFIFFFIILFYLPDTFTQSADTVLTNKKGTPILPRGGDIAIGTDALPYLRYLGNFFNGNTNNTLNLGSSTLYGKYFLTDNSAVRLLLHVSNSVSNNNYYVRDDAAWFQDPLSNDQVIDTRETMSSTLNLGAAYKKYRGYGRLLGFYGAQVSYYQNRTRYAYTYGNPITEMNPLPSSQFGYTNGGRLLREDNGLYYSAGGGILAGAEYYFLPKICIGAEINLSFYYNWSTQEDSDFEKWDGSEVHEYTILDSPGSSGFGINTDRPSTFGGLYLMFNF